MSRKLNHFIDPGTQGALWLVLAPLWLLCGCASHQHSFAYVSLPDPPAEEVREQVAVIRIVGRGLEETQFQQPMGKGKATGQAAWAGFGTPIVTGFATGSGYAATAGLFLAPLGGAVGAIYGAFAGMSGEEYQQICTTLRAAVEEADVWARFETGVTQTIRELTPAIAIASTNAPVENERILLEVMPTLVQLHGPTGINPPLALVLGVRVRLVRATDGVELYSGEFSYHGTTRSLREWADDGGASFRGEIVAVCRDLPTQIIERVFLYYPLPPSTAQSRLVPWSTEP